VKWKRLRRHTGDAVAEKRETEARAVEVALVHHPVVNRKGDTIGSAVTNLDIHDIARAARTYGVGRFFIVTPYESQIRLVEELLAHWVTGIGGEHNPDRREALSLVRLARSLDEVAGQGDPPVLIATSASRSSDCLDWPEARQLIATGCRVLLVFGTANGLSPELMARMAHRLPPLTGGGDYNHLSVRSAVSIVLDRLLGR